jgi:hypothetical protein
MSCKLRGRIKNFRNLVMNRRCRQTHKPFVQVFEVVKQKRANVEHLLDCTLLVLDEHEYLIAVMY